MPRQGDAAQRDYISRQPRISAIIRAIEHGMVQVLEQNSAAGKGLASIGEGPRLPDGLMESYEGENDIR